MKNASGVIVLTVVLLYAFISIPAFATVEKEPNNTPEEGNSIQVGETVEGLLQDGFDYFAITLPATGKTTVTLTGCPRGGQVQIGAKNFGYTGWQDSNGAETVSLTFDAQKTSGVIWVMPIFAGSVCGSDWCASQFVAGGPYHITKDSPNVPGSHEDKRILEPLAYKLTVRQAVAQSQSNPSDTAPTAPAKTSTSEDSATLGRYTMKRLHENNFGFSFELPDYWIWELLPDNGGYLLSGPADTEENEVIIVVQAVQKATNPGSSVVKQLQEARAQIEGVSGAEIRSEDMVDVSGRQVPFFLALYPGQTAKHEPTTFAHVQLVLESGLYYFWVSYAAPTEYFEKYQELFANMLTTFQIVETGANSRSMAPQASRLADARITVQAFNAGSGSMFAPRVKVKAQGFGSGAKLLKLYAVSADGKLKELQSRSCSDGATVDFDAVYNRLETKSFELRLYDAQQTVIARLKRDNA
ncbi:MAG: hypothetical protein JSW26_00995 [Desulfobacterales bacterium]|nr:MAG: hypothetical protein JSW26_00995 [Desulfobacterales bacterium]